jgi:hypothetical protein
VHCVNAVILVQVSFSTGNCFVVSGFKPPIPLCVGFGFPYFVTRAIGHSYVFLSIVDANCSPRKTRQRHPTFAPLWASIEFQRVLDGKPVICKFGIVTSQKLLRFHVSCPRRAAGNLTGRQGVSAHWRPKSFCPENNRRGRKRPDFAVIVP